MKKNANYYLDTPIRNSKGRLITCRVLVYIALAIVTIMCLFSFYLLIINSTRNHTDLQGGSFSALPKEFFIQNLMKTLRDTNTIMPAAGLLNSFIIAASSSLLTCYFSAMTAYAIHVYDFKGKKFAFNFIMVVMMIPTQVSTLGFVDLVNNVGLKDTFWPLIIPAIASPATFFYMKQYIDSTLPLEVVEAARVDGCNEFRTFNTIALPMLKPALAVQLIFAFVASWNNFFLPALILDSDNKKTIPIMISQLKSRDVSDPLGADMGETYMFILLAILPVVIVYFLISKHIIKGVTMGSVKG